MTKFAIRWPMLIGVVLAAAALSAVAAEPQLPGGLTAPSKPTHIPAFNLATASDRAVRTSDLRGKVIIARFWATW